jgi:hypothetical protein
MHPLPSARLFLVASLAVTTSCGLFTSGNDDPFKDAEVNAQIYEENTPTSSPVNSTVKEPTAFTTFSNRPVAFALNGYDGDLTKLELTRKINGVSSTCVVLDKADRVMSGFTDWAGSDTEYTLVATHEDGDTKSFGPFTVTVTPANRLIHASHVFTDQSADAITSGGSFLQTRGTQIGFGGYSGINFNTTLVEGDARIIDLVVVTSGGAVKAVSPDDAQAIGSWPAMKNECGYQTTRFAAYTGALDPDSTAMQAMTPEEITSLPDPAASGTSFNLTAGARFVYRTSDGKKGLVKVVSAAAGGASLAVSAVQ